jgi:hypothetical protein
MGSKIVVSYGQETNSENISASTKLRIRNQVQTASIQDYGIVTKF